MMYCTTVYIPDFLCEAGVQIARRYSYVTVRIDTAYIIYIKTHGSESRGQEEAGLRDEPVSYLQVAPL